MGGIDAIKESLQEGKKATKEGFEIDIKLIAHPVFALTCNCFDKEEGVKVLAVALDFIKAAIESKKGIFSIVSLPQIQKTDDKKDDEEDSDDSGDEKKSYKSESDPEDQDETMGDLDADALAVLEKMKVDDD